MGHSRNAIGQGHPDNHSGNHGNPHRRHGVARAPHHAGQGLVNGHRHITHSQNAHHLLAHLHHFRRFGKQPHQRPAQQQDGGHQRGADGQHQLQTVPHALLHPVHPAGAHILAGISSHGVAKGKIGHHGEAVHPHHHSVHGDNHSAEAVCQRLHHNGRHGENRLRQTGRQAQFDQVLRQVHMGL